MQKNNRYSKEPQKCPDYEYKYLEYPIVVINVQIPHREGITNEPKEMTWVAVRPCDDKYQNETFLGIYLGDISINVFTSYSRKDCKLSISNIYNPTIYVPKLNKIIYGCSSWWKRIEDEK